MLTPEERVRIRHHLGYMNVSSVATFVLGSPAAVETAFMIEGAMDRVLPQAIPLVRELLIKLDATEAQSFDNQENHAVDSLGDITINKEEFEQLAGRYRYWQGRLANVLGIVVNPYSKVASDAGGGVGTPVVG